MALTTTFVLVQSAARDKITLYDTTGLYNSTFNVTGYGGINPAFTTVTAITATLTLPDPTTLQVSTDDSKKYTFDVEAMLPNLVGDGYVITATTIGLSAGEKVPDGRYNLLVNYSGTWIVFGTPTAFSGVFNKDFVFINGLGCCADEALSDIKDLLTKCAPCQESMMKKVLIGMAYDSMFLNNNCAKPNQSLDILKVAQPLCEECGCGCA